MALFRRHAHPDAEVPDPVVEAWFARARLPAVDDAALARGRRLVAAKLAAPEPATAGSSFMRRLGWATAGGGGLWASMLGAAAAHPLAGAVTALALVAGGATAVEVSGIGPAVRETVGIQAQDTGDTPPQAASATPTSTHAALGAEAAEGPGASVTPAPGWLPGNLLTQIHDGRFVLRAQLVAVDDESLTLLTAEDEVTMPLSDEADVRVPGTPERRDDLASAVGQLAMVFGSCDGGVELLGPGCVIERVQVLGATSTGGAAERDSESVPGPAPSKPGASHGQEGDDTQRKHDEGPEGRGRSGGKPSSAGDTPLSPHDPSD